MMEMVVSKWHGFRGHIHGVVDDHELLYLLQYGDTPLHLAAWGSHTTCVEHLLSTPGIDVNVKDVVSWS